MTDEIENLKREYESNEIWGLSSTIDLHLCNPDFIKDASKIKQFVIELCDLIKMKRFGECKIVHFGSDEKAEGFSMIQLIDTSLISGHFSNKNNSVHLDVFSCKFYDPWKVAEFAKQFFQAKDYKLNYLLRK